MNYDLESPGHICIYGGTNTGKTVFMKYLTNLYIEDDQYNLDDIYVFTTNEYQWENYPNVFTEWSSLKDVKNKIIKETKRGLILLDDFNNEIDTIYNKIRGLSPYPASWTIIDNQNENIEAKIYSASKTLEEHQYSIGRIITTKTELKIAVKEGFILINEIQLPGKRKMNIKDLLNGYVFNAYSKMC